MPKLTDANDLFGKKIADLAELMLEGDIADEYDCQFIDNMIERFEKGWNFTDNQIAYVNTLHEKYYV